MLDCALPKVLARLFVSQSEHKSVLLLVAVVVVLHHHEGELLLFEVQLRDLGPVERDRLDDVSL